MSGMSKIRALGLAALVMLSMVFGGLITARVAGSPTAAVSPAPTAVTGQVPIVASLPAERSGSRTAVSNAIANLPDVVARVSPSVVEIETTGQQGGVGSGIVIDRDGVILTNYHVIEGAQKIVVHLRDGTAGAADVVGTDPGSDLAVIRASIQPQRLVPITFGNSDNARVGDPVFAIGNPFGQTFSVTSGIVSAVQRVTTSSFTGRPIRGVLQTDAALNPGNSGGPLFNATGEVIGINTSIENPSGRFSAGIGFATPSNTAQRFLPDMLKGQSVQHPMLGVQGVALDEVSAGTYRLSVTRGVYITGVDANAAAGQAGVRPSARTGLGGDVVLAIDGTTVQSFDDLALAIDQRKVGDTITLRVLRGGQTLELKATLGAWTQTQTQ